VTHARRPNASSSKFNDSNGGKWPIFGAGRESDSIETILKWMRQGNDWNIVLHSSISNSASISRVFRDGAMEGALDGRGVEKNRRFETRGLY
jgi:hypothetical protein